MEELKSSVTVEQLDDMIRESFALKQEHAELKQKAAEKDAELGILQDKISCILEELGRSEYSCKHGKFSFKYEQSFLVPKDEQDKEAFKKYLEDRGIFDSMWTVNSMTLNSFLKAQEQAAESLPEAIKRGEIHKKFSMRRY